MTCSPIQMGWCVFLCLAILMLGGGVKMQEDAPAHLGTYAASNAFLTNEELRTVALLKRIEIMFDTLEFVEKKTDVLDVNNSGTSRSMMRPPWSVKVGELVLKRYKIVAELQEGNYGKVYKCKDLQKDTMLAIKIMKNQTNHRYKEDPEIKMLSKLTSLVPKNQNLFVKMYDWFDYQGHKCIVFELLGKSVFDFLKDNNNSAFPIEHVRQMAYDLCFSVALMHTHGFTHNSLKSKNIVFQDDEYYIGYLSQEDMDKGKQTRILKNPAIKLIDFGSTTLNKHHNWRPIRQYAPNKAPEVVMNLVVTQAADIWSVGCIIFEMVMGFKMFDTHSRHEHLVMLERTLGQIPAELVNKSKLKYFSNGKLIWNEDSSGRRDINGKAKPLLSYIPKEKRGNKDWEELFQMISQMLRYEPSKRSSLAECLEHPFLKEVKKQLYF